jgi:hypothetical protein
MKFPKTTEFTLKRIIENINNIPSKGFSQETPKLTPEQKKKLQEMACMFESFGEALGKEDTIMNSAKGLSEFCSLAETYAVNEGGDWFNQNIVKKDMMGMRKKVEEYNKVAKECYARMQELGVLFEDIKHLTSRYFDTKGIQEIVDPMNPETPSGLHDINTNPPINSPQKL